jgi:sugar/nucleoside kinase (ribokinase family)
VAAAIHAREQGVLVSFDGGAHRYSPQLRELVTLSDICIVARHFAFAFSGQEDIEASAVLLRDCGPKVVVITAGAEGSWVFDHTGSSFHQPAFEMGRVVDTTGAGDAYHGAFLFGLVNNYSLRRCAVFASAVAALNTGSLGGRSALPSLDETATFLAGRNLPSV